MLFGEENGVVPGSDFSVGGAGVEELAGEGEGRGVGGGVGFESGEARVRGGGSVEEVWVWVEGRNWSETWLRRESIIGVVEGCGAFHGEKKR